MISILDYGSGNLRSAQRAFALTGHEVKISSRAEDFLNADAFVVPGVGAFGACMSQLESIGGTEIIEAAVKSGKAIFGICVGMQIFFASGSEKGEHRGLGYFEGEVAQLDAPVLPHIGWNDVESTGQIYRGVENEKFYFVHSFGVKSAPENAEVAWCDYSGKFIASIERENIFATQFHPEKSGAAGTRLIQNWSSRI